MALISCPDCGAQVSDAAVSCPKCGYPILRWIEGLKSKKEGEKVQLIEKTSKKYKLQILLASIIMICSVTLMLGSCCVAILDPSEDPNSVGVRLSALGLLGLFFGGVWYGIIRLLAWWDHG